MIHLTSAPTAVSSYSHLSRQNLLAVLRPGLLSARCGSECRVPEIPEGERTCPSLFETWTLHLRPFEVLFIRFFCLQDHLVPASHVHELLGSNRRCKKKKKKRKRENLNSVRCISPDQQAETFSPEIRSQITCNADVPVGWFYMSICVCGRAHC